MSSHFTLLTTYTYSHCVSSWDFAGELAGTLYQNPLNRKTGERGNCGFDHRHSFNASFVLLSPGAGSGAARLVTRDWQISPNISLFTGNPIQVTDGKDISLSGQGQDRPLVILPDQVYSSPRSQTNYLNPAAFQCAGSNAACTVFSGLFGNLGRNSLYGPDQRNFDIAVSRRFSVTERLKLEFRSDIFNILNHANWNNPGTSLSNSATFGQITTFSSPRIIQMAMKVYF